jgi:hypothetical protein
MRNGFIVLILAGVLAVPAQSQTGTSPVAFNLLAYEGGYSARIFTFDQTYSETYGVPVPIPFEIQMPIRDDVDMIADGKPDGGFVKFTFATQDEPPRFIENVHILTASLPRFPAAYNPPRARLENISEFLAQAVFPQATAGFQNPQINSVRAIDVNGITAIEVAGNYLDAENGPMVLRIVALPHPLQDESTVIFNHISNTLVPIAGVDQLPLTLGGRAISSFVYKVAN